MNDENLEITKELENLESIENNPESPALDIENEIIDINEKMDSIEETIESIDKLSDEVKDIKTMGIPHLFSWDEWALTWQLINNKRKNPGCTAWIIVSYS